MKQQNQNSSTPDSLLELLQSAGASARANAARELIRQNAKIPAHVLLDLLERETVGLVRDRLRILIGSQPTKEPLQSRASEDSSGLSDLLANAGSMLRHETEPVIGFLRSTANQEIPKFRESQTYQRIEDLRHTLTAIIQILELGGRQDRAAVSLFSLTKSVIESVETNAAIRFNVNPSDSEDLSDTDFTIKTNESLLKLLLVNVLRNAVDATNKVPKGDNYIEINIDMTDSEFTINITNPFNGQSFESSDVQSIGASSNSEGRGNGMYLIRLVSSQLGYHHTLDGAGGVARFALWGGKDFA